MKVPFFWTYETIFRTYKIPLSYPESPPGSQCTYHFQRIQILCITGDLFVRGVSTEVWVQGCPCGFCCEQLTWKELPCGRVGNKRTGGNWTKVQGAEKETQGSHFRSEEHSPQCGVICVHLHLNKGQSVRLDVILFGRIFLRAEVCSLISSCCRGTCSWDM